MIGASQMTFKTGEVADLLGLPVWRLMKFFQGKEYGLGTRKAPGKKGIHRIYTIENVCEIALAHWLFESGLRSSVIGEVLRQLRSSELLSGNLSLERPQADRLYLLVEHTSPSDSPPKARVEYVPNSTQTGNLPGRGDSPVTCFPIGLRLAALGDRIRQRAVQLSVAQRRATTGLKLVQGKIAALEAEISAVEGDTLQGSGRERVRLRSLRDRLAELRQTAGDIERMLAARDINDAVEDIGVTAARSLTGKE